jgi:hypothetical protein
MKKFRRIKWLSFRTHPPVPPEARRFQAMM